MSEDYTEAFNSCVRDVLKMLVPACPLPLELNVETFDLPKGSYEANSSPSPFIGGFYNQTPEEKLLESTLDWLVAEGFIRKIGDTDYVATLQTLKLYGAIPNALSE